jgi:hypothetical protein
LPSGTTPGSCKFIIDIPDTITDTFDPGTIYGACRATYGDGSKDTLFKIEMKVEVVF